MIVFFTVLSIRLMPSLNRILHSLQALKYADSVFDIYDKLDEKNFEIKIGNKSSFFKNLVFKN